MIANQVFVRSLAAALAVAAGCTYEPGTPVGGQQPLDVDGGTVTMDPSVDAATTTGTPPNAKPCRYPDAQLRLCLEFEDDPISPKVTDRSGLNLNAPARGLDRFAHRGF